MGGPGASITSLALHWGFCRIMSRGILYSRLSCHIVRSHFYAYAGHSLLCRMIKDGQSGIKDGESGIKHTIKNIAI